MRRVHLAASLALASASAIALAQSQHPTKTYTYDELGRLVEVEITNGSQDGEQRIYSYDRADNRTNVVSTGATPNPSPTPSPSPSPTPTPTSTPTPTPSCVLSPVGFTTTQSGYAYPRVYAPTSAGCGYQIELDFTITVPSYGGFLGGGPVDPNQINAVFAGYDDTLEGNEHAKVVVIYPIDDLTTATEPIVLHVNWIAPDGNATFASPGYSVVTINPD